jgi:23S rRNA pseudouridine1911/1915/1917 synthase
MGTTYEYRIPEGFAGTCRQYLKNCEEYSSRVFSYIKREGGFFVNGEPRFFNAIAHAGDLLAVAFPDEDSDAPGESAPLLVLHEDEDILVVNKAPKMVVHPTHDIQEGTLANAVYGYWRERGQRCKARFVNRLDRDTSGAVVIAKNKYVHHFIQRSYSSGASEGHKTYIALLEGSPKEPAGRVDAAIGRPDPMSIRREVLSGAKDSLTEYEVIAENGGFSLVRLRLLSGRTHQIRVHMAYIGCPVAGDGLYGTQREGIAPRLALHCFEMSLLHPRMKRVESFRAPLPQDMREAALSCGLALPEGLGADAL